MKTALTADEIGEIIGLSGRRTRDRAAADRWKFDKRQGAGGGKIYPVATLPKDVRLAIQEYLFAEKHPTDATSAGAVSVGETGSLPASPATTALARTSSFGASAVTGTASTKLASIRADDLTDKQRACSVARISLLEHAYALRDAGASLEKAFAVVVAHAGANLLPAALQAMVSVANARNAGGRVISTRTMLHWHVDYQRVKSGEPSERIRALAPVVPTPSTDFPPDVFAVIALLDTSGNSLMAATRKYARANGFLNNPILVNRLYYRADRAYKKIPASVMNKRTHTGSALAAKKPYVMRDWSNHLPNDVWYIDGHGMKGKWAHPDHGQPFVPEFTRARDVVTRRTMGWSVSYAENQIAVIECLSNGIKRFGKPGSVSSDGGGGQLGGELSNEEHGFYATWDIHHETRAPYSPQSGGQIERSWQMDAMHVARENPLFRGSGHDKDTLRKSTIALDKALTAAARDPSNVVPMRLLPPFGELIGQLTAFIDEADNAPCRSHPKNPATGLHYTPVEYWDKLVADNNLHFHKYDDPVDHLMFMPFRLRPSSRGQVRIHDKWYGNQDLYTLADGQDVRVHYDITNPLKVWIADQEGRFICEAKLDWNKRPGQAMAVTETTRLRRLHGQQKLLDRKSELLDRERDGIHDYSARNFAAPEPFALPDAAPEAPEDDSNVIPIRAEPAQPAQPAADARPLFHDTSHKYRWLMAHRAVCTAGDETWLAAFADTRDYERLEEIFEREGIAWHAAGGGTPEAFKGAVA